MSYGFDASPGTGTGHGDAIITPLTGVSAARTWLIWAYRTGNGFNGEGHAWDKSVTNFQSEALYTDVNFGGRMIAEFAWTTTNHKAFATRPSANAWHSLITTYDNSSTANVAEIYADGVASVTSNQTPVGSPVTNSDHIALGNRPKDFSLTWQGYLAEFAVWNRILTSGEIASLAGGAAASSIPSGLVAYLPLVTTTTDTIGGASTTNGTPINASGTHPTILAATMAPPPYIPSFAHLIGR